MFKWLKSLFTRKSVTLSTPKLTLCIIDDDRSVHFMIQKYFPNYDVRCMYQLPSDEAELGILKTYDVLIVDCQGIGNRLYKDGQQFLAKHYDRPMHQKVIYYSGLEPDSAFETILEKKGMRWYTKGYDPMGLVTMVHNYSVIHPNRGIRPPVDYAKTLENMKKLRRKRRRGRRGFTIIELLIVVGVICSIMVLLIKGCNRQIVDIDWNFKRAVVRDGFGGYSGVINIKSWRDYDQSDMVQITTDKGQVILTHSTNIILLGGK